jgi:hypothetical protein
MPFCPHCKFEYRSGVERCPDCGGELLDAPPDSSTTPDRSAADFEQVRLCTLIGEIHAKLLQDALASQGIPSRAQSGWRLETSLAGMHPPPLGATSAVSIAIFVNRPDLPSALVIYEDFERRGLQQVDWEQPPDEFGPADA